MNITVERKDDHLHYKLTPQNRSDSKLLYNITCSTNLVVKIDGFVWNDEKDNYSSPLNIMIDANNPSSELQGNDYIIHMIKDSSYEFMNINKLITKLELLPNLI
jgi:hypothetical protein